MAGSGQPRRSSFRPAHRCPDILNCGRRRSIAIVPSSSTRISTTVSPLRPADHGERQQIEVSAHQRGEIGEIFVAAGGGSGMTLALRQTGGAIIGTSRRLHGCLTRLRWRLDGAVLLGRRGLWAARRRHDRGGLLRRLARRRLGWRRLFRLLGRLWRFVLARYRLGFASGLPISSEARRPGGGLTSGGGFASGLAGAGGRGGGSGGGGSTTSWTAIGVNSGGWVFGQSISNSRKSACSAKETIGPTGLGRPVAGDGRSAIGAARSAAAAEAGVLAPAPRQRGAAARPFRAQPATAKGAAARGGRRPAVRSGGTPRAGHPAVGSSPASASHSASSSSLTPSAAALVAFEPGSAPATT